MGDHRHRRYGREAGDPIRSVSLDRVHLGCRDHLHGLGPRHSHQSALSACLLIATTALRVIDDIGPGQNRIVQSLLGFAIQLQQDAARVRIPDSSGGVGVPGERGTTRAAARLVLRPIRTDRGIVSLLRLPGDDPVADVDLPRTGTGAVHTVGGSHNLVVAPAIAIEHIASATAFTEGHPTIVGLLPSREKLAQLQESIGRLAIHPRGDRRTHKRDDIAGCWRLGSD